MANVILAITGASGAVYALRLLQVLLEAGQQVHLTISPAGQIVLREELGVTVDLDAFQETDLFQVAMARESEASWLTEMLGPNADRAQSGQVIYYHHQDLMAPIASGSFLSGGMIVCPCSGSTLGAIAHATPTNLIQRAAEVQLKERRPLVLVPRETPLSSLQLENMHRAAQAGAVVMPATPGWYHGVHSLADLVDFMVARMCDQLGIENRLIRRWGEARRGGGLRVEG